MVFQEVTSERGKKRALVTADLHLIWNWTPDNTTECYDILHDPGETKDVWGLPEGAPPAREILRRLAVDRLQRQEFGPALRLQIRPDRTRAIHRGIVLAVV